MIRLFFQLCKCYKQISFENEIYNFNEQLKSINIEELKCPFCGAKHSLSAFASYNRHLLTYENNAVQDNLVKIQRYICSSCGHTHAILPSVIVPYMSFSFNFTISIIHDYLINRFHSVGAMCEHYCIAISTFYRILEKFKDHKKLWLGLLTDKLTSNLDFIQHLINSTFVEIQIFLLNFFNKTGRSFFQETS